MTIPLDIREVIVCDDIRREDNGKAILIGVYYGHIVLRQFPATLPLSFWLQGRARENVGSAKAQFKIDIRDQGAEQIPPIMIDADFDAPSADTTTGVLVFQTVPITVRQPGRLVLSINEDGEWLELLNKKILDFSPS